MQKVSLVTAEAKMESEAQFAGFLLYNKSWVNSRTGDVYSHKHVTFGLANTFTCVIFCVTIDFR